MTLRGTCGHMYIIRFLSLTILWQDVNMEITLGWCGLLRGGAHRDIDVFSTTALLLSPTRI